MKSIEVRYFALLREQARCERETLQVKAETYADLYDELRAKHDFSLPSEVVKVAVNDEFISMKAQVLEGARVVFIPPVAGG